MQTLGRGKPEVGVLVPNGRYGSAYDRGRQSFFRCRHSCSKRCQTPVTPYFDPGCLRRL